MTIHRNAKWLDVTGWKEYTVGCYYQEKSGKKIKTLI